MTRAARAALLAGALCLPAAGGLPPAPALGAETCLHRLVNEPLECLGTEPFWNLTIRGGKAEFSQLGEKARVWYAFDCRYAEGRRDTWILPVRELDSNERGHAILLEGQSCSDGMSDRGYPHTLLLAAPGGKGYRGCCQLQPPR